MAGVEQRGRLGRQTDALVWSSGKTAASQGIDLPTVSRLMSTAALVHWHRVLLGRNNLYEAAILERELHARGLSTRTEDAAGQKVLFTE